MAADPPASDALVIQALVTELQGQLRMAQAENARLRHQLTQALRRLYGRKTEQLAGADQGTLPLGPPADAAAEATPDDAPDDPDPAAAPGERPRRQRGRTPLPKDLPRQRTVLEPDASALTCAHCTTAKTRIGEDVTEELEFEPAVLRVHEYVRPKYACPACEAGVVQAALPPRPIDQGRPGPGLLAHVVTAKYADHLPLHRQEGIFARHGVGLSRRTLCDWVAAVAELVAPIVAEMRRTVLASHVIHSDDTRITVQAPGHRGGSRRGYLWVYGGDQGDLVYDYTASRGRDGPLHFLRNYHGYLQADAYAGYDGVFATGMVTQLGCWAHGRRYVFEAVDTALEPATRLLALIRRLYAVEREATGRQLDAAGRQALRAAESRPLLAAIEAEVTTLTPTVLPKSPFGEALGYLRRQWQALTRYVEDGALAIDNNASERALRMVAVGRKNWLFAGSEAGAQRAATLYSLIATCKLHRLDPFAYLRDVIARVATHPMRRIAELTPRGWQAQRLAATTG